jgi:mono/diheme cytochrome c family protein
MGDVAMFDFRLLVGKILSAFFIAIAAGVGGLSATFPSLAQQGDSSVKPGPDYWHPGWMRHDRWSARSVSPEMRARMKRHRTFMHAGVPLAYRGLQSTVSMTQDVIKAGGKLYGTHCASCHGERGLGDGTTANSITPSPALLAHMIQRPMVIDEYLLWTISDGGKKFGTDMPAFKGKLSKEQIWKIVAYMRAGLPNVDK